MEGKKKRKEERRKKRDERKKMELWEELITSFLLIRHRPHRKRKTSEEGTHKYTDSKVIA
jgi:hypothetical protein